MRFTGGLAPVRNGGLSVIVRCAQGESRLYLLGIPVNDLLLNLKSHSKLHEPPMT